jgi:hypothetical protein
MRDKAFDHVRGCNRFKCLQARQIALLGRLIAKNNIPAWLVNLFLLIWTAPITETASLSHNISETVNIVLVWFNMELKEIKNLRYVCFLIGSKITSIPEVTLRTPSQQNYSGRAPDANSVGLPGRAAKLLLELNGLGTG